MKVGSLVYATEQGLGVLAKAFYDNGIVTDPWVLKHSSRPTRLDWYPGGTPVLSTDSGPLGPIYEQLVKGVDVLLAFETPFSWPIFRYCRQVGVKTVLMLMYECTPKDVPTGCEPDLVLSPSSLDQKYYPESELVTVPVYGNTWRPRGNRIETFVHNAGHGGLRGRNGTEELVEAWPSVNPQAKLILRSQDPLKPSWRMKLQECGNVDLRIGSVPHGQLYLEGECFVFPEKFNGLSLPLQEAYAAGMVVAATARVPNTDWLPAEPLIPMKGTKRASVSARMLEFDEAEIDPADIAATLNRLYGSDPTPYCQAGRKWGLENDWRMWKPKYLDLLHELVD